MNNCNTAHNLFYQLWRFDQEGVHEDFRDTYQYKYKSFLDCLTNDVDVAISFFGTLNLNKEYDSFAMSFATQIIKRLKTQEEKEKFIDYISTLNKKYPNSPYINWDSLVFFVTIASMDN